MSINPSQISEDIKRVGARNVRIVPTDDKYQIEIMENGTWRAITDGLSMKMASKLVNEATNKVILG